MKLIKYVFIVVLGFSGCVEEEDAFIDPIFKITDSIYAERNRVFRVSLKTESNIPDGKEVTISTSHGSLSSILGKPIGSFTNEIKTTIHQKNIIFYFQPGTKPVRSASFSLALEKINNHIEFEIHPIEPDEIVLMCDPLYPISTDNIVLKAVLLRNNSPQNLCSEGLRINFDVTDLSGDSLRASIQEPKFFQSSYKEDQDLIVASANLSRKTSPGTFVATASYNRSNGQTVRDTIKVKIF